MVGVQKRVAALTYNSEQHQQLPDVNGYNVGAVFGNYRCIYQEDAARLFEFEPWVWRPGVIKVWVPILVTEIISEYLDEGYPVNTVGDHLDHCEELDIDVFEVSEDYVPNLNELD